MSFTGLRKRKRINNKEKRRTPTAFLEMGFLRFMFYKMNMKPFVFNHRKY